MGKPRRRKTRENKLNQVQKGGLDIAEGEIGGPWVLAYFGADVDWGKGAVGVDENGVEGISVERSDKKWCLNFLKVDFSCDSP